MPVGGTAHQPTDSTEQAPPGPSRAESDTVNLPRRLADVCGADAALRDLVTGSLAAAKATLPRMWRPDAGAFAYTLRGRTAGGGRGALAQVVAVRPEGTSVRYGAIVALGARHLEEPVQRHVLDGRTAARFADELVAGVAADRDPNADPGAAALVAWAATACGGAAAGRAMALLPEAAARARYTVDVAWALSAYCAAGDPAGARGQRDRLLAAFSPRGGLFPHVVGVSAVARHRRFIGCFADQVYPVQALARYHRAFGDTEAMGAADDCAARICALQGDAGQWWWHYDWRSGEVAEGYPVYAVHQNAMAPMALLDLAEAGGADHAAAIRRGLGWLAHAPEIDGSLVADDLRVTWRKVARREPRKLVRGVVAAAHALSERPRLGLLGRAFPPVVVDHETRPYELGWLLDTWLGP